MNSQNIKSIGEDMMCKVKEKYGEMAIWSKIEGQIALICAQMNNPTGANKKKKFVEEIKSIKVYLTEEGIDINTTSFLDEEILLHEEAKVVSLYHENDDSISDTLVDGFSRIAPMTEGVISVPHSLNYAQLSKLTNAVYNKTKLIKFFISKEKTLRGKIVAEYYSQSQNITVATFYESKKRDKGTGEPDYKGVKLFGDPVGRTENIIIKEIPAPMYVYRFISEKNKDYVLFTSHQVEIGDYTISGVETTCSDFRSLTESAKLPTKLPYIFVHSLQNRIVKYKSHNEFLKKLNSLNIKTEEFFEYPFCVTVGKKNMQLLQPTWYKWLIWSWITHEPKGLFSKYPMHLIQSGEKNSGKSLMLNALHSRTGEALNVFSGSSSTLKNLIPSFRNNPAKLGYLAESNRFSYCDEFLRCILKTNSKENGGSREESVGTMNDLLEHQKREAGSGNSSVNVNMTSRIFATTNPVRGTKSMPSLLKSLDESFLSRWMIYYQTRAHHEMILNSTEADLKNINYDIENEDWISILDYLHSFSAKYDNKRIEKIYISLIDSLSEDLNRHYEARHRHHIECLMDGIIKTRCLITRNIEFKAIEKDYETLKIVWTNLIGSWMTSEMIKKTPKTQRIYLIQESSQFLYWKILHFGIEIEYQALVEMVKEDLSGQKFLDAYYDLLNNDLIIKVLGKVQTYDYFKAKSEENEKIAGQREL